jgi:hypothetical protein
MKKIKLILIALTLFSAKFYAQVPSYVPTTGLVGWWPFDGNANDLSGNGNNGTVNGATLTTDRFGVANKAYSFDGVSNFIQMLNAGPSGNSGVTVSFWLKTNMSVNASPSGGVGYIFGYGGNSINSMGQSLNITVNGSAWVNACNQSITFDTYGAALAKTVIHNNSWDYYTVVNDPLAGSNVVDQKIYKNGVLLTQNCISSPGSPVNNTNFSNLTPIRIGKFYGTTCGNCQQTDPNYLFGSLDDIGIWNRALTQSEITALYTNTLPPSISISSSNSTICSGSNVTLTATTNAINATYLWMPGAFTTPSITVSPSSTTLYTCTVSENGQNSSGTALITVDPTPTVNPISNYTFCNNTWSSLIAFNGTAGATYNWTNSNPNTGLSFTNGTGSIFFMTSSNSNTQVVSSVITVTPVLNGCNGTPQSFTISVNPTPSVYQFDWNYCHGQTTTPVALQGTFTNVSWTNTNSSIGLASTGTGTLPSFTAQNTSISTATGQIVATPTYTNGGVTCSGAAFSFEFHINPIPVVNQMSNITICAGSSIGQIPFTGTGTSYEWTNSNTGIGLGPNGIGDIPAFTPTLVNNTTTTANIAVTPVYFDYISCYGTTQNFLITINAPTGSSNIINACDSYQLNGQTYSQSGIYSQILPNAFGCDSTITIDLTITESPITPIVSVVDDTTLVTAQQDSVTYQWILCSDLTPVPGATNPVFNPTANAYYAVIVSNSCGSDTSDCAEVTTIGLNEMNPNVVLVYPNPNNGEFTIEVPQEMIGMTYQLFDLNGRILKTGEIHTHIQAIQTGEIARGAYWLQIGSQKPIQIVKN